MFGESFVELKRGGERMAPRFLACKDAWMVVMFERGPGLFW